MAGSDGRDREEILRLIEADTRAYLMKDYEAWAECWAQVPETRRLVAWAAGGMRVDEGWDTFSSQMKDALTSHPDPNTSHNQIRREKMNLVIGSDIAWVTYDQIGVDTGDEFDLPGIQHELKIFHKIKGKWKIVCMTVLQRSTDHAQCPLIEVDSSSRVAWMNAEAKEMLPHFPSLVVGAGRLRARDKEGDRSLQEAVSAMFQLNDAESSRLRTEKTVAPVVLEDDDYSVPQYCWVSLEDARVLISFDDHQLTKRKLSWAKEVFGLSSAQVQVATLIARGHDIAPAASLLDVSVNTVRTHLQRMYDKTGARSRHALVRAILNMEPPIP